MKWYKVFESEEQALNTVKMNKAKLLKIGDRRICLSNHNNKIFASKDKCPHNGASLSEGRVNYLGEIICPWHGYRYALNDGKECQNRAHDLKTYPIEYRSEGIFIGIPD